MSATGLSLGQQIGLVAAVAAAQCRAEAAEHAATHDELTGLLNRRGFMGLRLPAPAALVLLDLDGFKPVNDRYGHGAGDMVLAEVGRRLGELPGVVAARLGGDEFVLVVDPATVDPIRVVVAARHVIAAPVGIAGGRVVLVTATCGVASAFGRAALLERADQAMYGAKRAGSGYRVWTRAEGTLPTDAQRRWS